MATKQDLDEWILDAIGSAGGAAQPIDVARHVWAEHESDLRDSGDLFYTWQYDLRWAAQRLRDAGHLKPKAGQRRGTWDLA